MRDTTTAMIRQMQDNMACCDVQAQDAHQVNAEIDVPVQDLVWRVAEGNLCELQHLCKSACFVRNSQCRELICMVREPPRPRKRQLERTGGGSLAVS